MTDSSTFGGALNTDTAQYGSDADAPILPTPPATSSPTASSFGSGIGLPSIGPNYKVDPQAGYLDQQESLISQRLQRAQSVATNPFIAVFDPAGRQAAIDFAQKAPAALMQVQQQKATIQANQQEAQSLGFGPGEVPDQATHEQRVEFAKSKALTGNMKVYQGLAAVDPKAAESIADQVHEVMGSHLDNAQYAFDKLSIAQSQGDYTRTLQSLRNEGKLKDIEALGVKIPDAYGDFLKAQAGEGKALRDARIGLNDAKNKLEQRNSFEGMDKKEADSYAGRLQTVYGDNLGVGQWSRRQADGARGLVIDGLTDPRKLGNGVVIATPEQRKELKESFEQAVPKENLEKYRDFNRTYQLATTDGKGKPVAPGEINTNPNVQQGIAEGLASMLRGGSGGANVGLLKIEEKKRGYLQNLFDTITSNKGAALDTLTGSDVQPYLSKLTQGQVRDVLDALKGYNDEQIGGRVSRIAQRAGALGLDTSAFGLSEKEAGGLNDAIETGRQAQINDWMQKGRHQTISGGDGALILGAQRVSAGAAGLPPGTTPSTTQPGATPLPSPAQQNGPQPLPGGPAPTRPGGSPQVTAGATAAPAVPTPPGGSPPPASQSPTPGAAPSGGGFPTGGAPPINQVVSKAFADFAAHNGGTPQQAQAVADRVMANPRVTAKLDAGQVPSEKDLAAAAGAGGNKTLLQHLRSTLDKYLMQGVAPDQREAASAEAGNKAVENLPAIGGTTAAIAGAAGGPVTAALASGAGSAAGQSLKDYLQGRPQDPAQIAKEGALGVALGVGGPAGRPVLSAALRAGGAAAVEGGASLASGEGAGQAAAEAGTGAAESIGGEAFGRALGMAGHKVWGLFSPESKTAVQAAAKVLSEQEPKITVQGPEGAEITVNGEKVKAGSQVDNPAYQKAEETVKDAGLKPEEAAYAYKAASEGVPRGEAQMTRPVAAEQKDIGAGYNQLRSEVGAAGAAKMQQAGGANVSGLRASPKLTDGPLAAVENGKVVKSQANQDLAQHIEAAVTAPAANWQEKWQHLQDARSTLLTAERDALGSTAAGKTQIAKDMRTLADTVRAQQTKAATYVFGPEQGKAVIQRLQVLDTRYRNLMDATNGGDVMAAARLTGEAGRDADRKFKAFAAGDPTAIAAWNALRGPRSNVEKDVRTLVGAESIPYLGKLISAAKMASGLREYMAERAAGDPVKFKDLVQMPTGTANRTVRNLAGTAGARTAVSGGVGAREGTQ